MFERGTRFKLFPERWNLLCSYSLASKPFFSDDILKQSHVQCKTLSINLLYRLSDPTSGSLETAVQISSANIPGGPTVICYRGSYKSCGMIRTGCLRIAHAGRSCEVRWTNLDNTPISLDGKHKATIYNPNATLRNLSYLGASSSVIATDQDLDPILLPQ